jgi:N-sulfoglucosamine sulfohydrolase
MKKILTLPFVLAIASSLHAADQRPNIVWIVGEDMGPELGCYGDAQAITPNMDRLAREGARFTRCFTHAPVCAPSRSGLITGRYPTTIGTHHMRSKLIVPPPTFTSLLRKAGYFVAWPGKTDFNFDVPADAFDSTVNWLNKGKLPRQPFFAYINFPESHESSIRMMDKFQRFTADLTSGERHDPAKMAVPPYHPDAPEVRRDLANYYDLVTVVDHKVGAVLKLLESQGVASNTVVIFTGDHGRGLPRSKRWVYDSGIHVPLIVRWPGKIKPGSVREDLVSFIDFAPTMLALAGVAGPDLKKTTHVPGGADSTHELFPPMQGIVFLGSDTQERKYIFAARDRMDETPDRIRAVRNERFKYIRNFEPQLSYAQRIAYMEEMPTMQVWRRLNAEGKLNDVQKLFFAPAKPKEELYDSDADPHEIRNLVDSPKHQAVLKELRAALDDWIRQTGDLGATPETDLIKRGLVRDVSDRYADRKQEN